MSDCERLAQHVGSGCCSGCHGEAADFGGHMPMGATVVFEGDEYDVCCGMVIQLEWHREEERQ